MSLLGCPLRHCHVDPATWIDVANELFPGYSRVSSELRIALDG
jgi:hypothetical protein